jgi:flavin-dependent thymidylate synthase
MSSETGHFADVAMYLAEEDASAKTGDVRPRVTLISMTPNPLRVMAAASGMYVGDVTRDASEVSKATALARFGDMTRTKLQAPLEFIDLHFLLEGVTRAFTHQLVRQRTAVYVQESQRFAVKGNAAWEVAFPPSTETNKDWEIAYRRAVSYTSHLYDSLIASGMPAEDARGLLPTNITTRIHYKTNLRGLAEHAGMRLCSQAQYEWKQVWHEMIEAILDYGPAREYWQQRAIVGLFRPVCYLTGKCEFMTEADRHCVIRDRVEAHHVRGEGPDLWADIDPFEPISEGAARMSPRVVNDLD